MRRILLGALGAILGVSADLIIRYGPETLTRIVGAGLLAIGLPFMLLARRQLGRGFAVGPPAKSLVTHGLYARVPHPIYLFLDLASLGGVILLRRAWLLALLAGLVALQVWQARREAKMLEGAFGDEYRNYRARTWW